MLEENKNFAEIRNKNGEESGLKEEIQMITCKSPAHPDDYLKKVGPLG